LWLLAEPVSLELSPESYAFHSLSICSGPERIESGWWDGADVARDYYVARNTVGETLWIFEDRKSPGQWYLHGRFG
jgi:protein ImuB